MDVLRLPYPPSSNRYWRVNRQTGKPYRSPEAKAYITTVGWECAAQGYNEPTAETVSLHLQFHHDAGRRIDLTNGIKILEDALKGCCAHRAGAGGDGWRPAGNPDRR